MAASVLASSKQEGNYVKKALGEGSISYTLKFETVLKILEPAAEREAAMPGFKKQPSCNYLVRCTQPIGSFTVTIQLGP